MEIREYAINLRECREIISNLCLLYFVHERDQEIKYIYEKYQLRGDITTDATEEDQLKVFAEIYNQREKDNKRIDRDMAACLLNIMVHYSIKPHVIATTDFVTPLLKDNMLKFLCLFAQMSDDYVKSITMMNEDSLTLLKEKESGCPLKYTYNEIRKRIVRVQKDA